MSTGCRLGPATSCLPQTLLRWWAAPLLTALALSTLDAELAGAQSLRAQDSTPAKPEQSQTASAQNAPGPALVPALDQKGPGLPPTRFGTQVLAENPLIVAGAVESVTRIGLGTAVVRLRIEELLLKQGAERVPEAILILTQAGDFQSGARGLLVLQPFGSGGRYQVQHRVDARDPDYRAKLSAARSQIQLMNIDGSERRAAATFEMLLELMGKPDAWSRANALSELNWVAAVNPDILNAERLRRLRHLGASSTWAEVRYGVESVANEMVRRTQALRLSAQQESSSP